MSSPITPPVPRQACKLPPCCECGNPDAGAYGFGPPLYLPAKHFCSGCTPSRTGVGDLPPAAAVVTPELHHDLFGRVA